MYLRHNYPIPTRIDKNTEWFGGSNAYKRFPQFISIREMKIKKKV